jgi:hypothetical protein
MNKPRIVVAIAVAMLVAAGHACVAQSDNSAPPSIEQRLAGFADRMRLGLSIASVAAFSPTVSDAHGQAERLITLLRGDPHEAVPGLLPEAALLSDWIAARSFDPALQRTLLGAAANVQGFLRLAIEAAISADRDRSLPNATEDLLHVYACLLAVWGQPINGIVVPGLVMLLRAFDVPVTA